MSPVSFSKTALIAGGIHLGASILLLSLPSIGLYPDPDTWALLPRLILYLITGFIQVILMPLSLVIERIYALPEATRAIAWVLNSGLWGISIASVLQQLSHRRGAAL